jgi:hypothetical protein
MTILIVLIFVIMVSYDLPGLLKTKQKAKSIAIYFILVTISFALSILLVLGKAPKSPSVFIEKIVKLIF